VSNIELVPPSRMTGAHSAPLDSNSAFTEKHPISNDYKKSMTHDTQTPISRSQLSTTWRHSWTERVSLV